MSRKKKTSLYGTYIVLIVAVILINFMGISYAYWTNTPQVINTVSTGKMDPSFTRDYGINSSKGNGNLRVEFNDNYVMNVQGEVDTNFQAFINYILRNDGSIPARYVSQKVYSQDGLTIQPEAQYGILNPYENYPNNGHNTGIQINANKAGLYTFEIELLFKQWNR